MAVPFMAMACIFVVYTVVAYIAMAYTVMAYTVLAYVAMSIEIGPVWSWHV